MRIQTAMLQRVHKGGGVRRAGPRRPGHHFQALAEGHGRQGRGAAIALENDLITTRSERVRVSVRFRKSLRMIVVLVKLNSLPAYRFGEYTERFANSKT